MLHFMFASSTKSGIENDREDLLGDWREKGKRIKPRSRDRSFIQSEFQCQFAVLDVPRRIVGDDDSDRLLHKEGIFHTDWQEIRKNNNSMSKFGGCKNLFIRIASGNQGTHDMISMKLKHASMALLTFAGSICTDEERRVWIKKFDLSDIAMFAQENNNVLDELQKHVSPGSPLGLPISPLEPSVLPPARLELRSLETSTVAPSVTPEVDDSEDATIPGDTSRPLTPTLSGSDVDDPSTPPSTKSTPKPGAPNPAQPGPTPTREPDVNHKTINLIPILVPVIMGIAFLICVGALLILVCDNFFILYCFL